MPLELLMELIILCNLHLNIPLEEDVHGMNVLLISLSGDLRNESSGIVRLLRSRSGSTSLSGGHLHQNKQKKRSEAGFIEN